MKKSKISILCVVLAMAFCLQIGAFAVSKLETISAYLNRGITVRYNGIAQTLKDSSGATVYPITYNGTTYLPVRAISNMMGVSVDWESSSQTVYIGEKPGEKQYLMEVCPPYQTSGRNVELLTMENGNTTNMSGETYTNGFVFDFTQAGHNFIQFNLNGQYDVLEFYSGHVDGTGTRETDHLIKIYLDDKLAMSIPIDYTQLAQKLTLQLDGALSMRIEGYGFGLSGFHESWGLCDMVVS